MQFDAHYQFDVSVDGTGRASVVERLTATNTTSTGIDHLDLFVLPNFDAPGFREFELASIRVDGRAVETRGTQDGANLRVELRRALQPGRTARLVVLFSLRPATPAQGDGDLAAALSRRSGMVQFLLWYPMLSDGHGVSVDSDGGSATPASPIDYAIRTDAPATFAVPGTVTRRTEREVRGTLAHARDFAFAVGRGIRTWSGHARSGVAVTVYGPAKAPGATTLALAIGAVDRFEALLRTPYPAADLVVVAGSTNMESSGIVFVDRNHVEDPYTVAHEVAHQWFHWLVGNDQLREPWLDEAFATYLAGGLVPRHEDGFCSDLPVNEPVWRFENVDPRITWQRCDDYMQTVYYKGSWLLHAVRAAMGDGAFIDSLEDYLARYRFGVATTADLVGIWRTHSAAVTDELLCRWLDLRPRSAGPRRPV
ncbi:MAG TPA: M1 family aminopeptidase [Patescibacteria group bacterium]|nr:M1 family aminopeptidase [Patescibacteria group bacterium]